MTQDEIKFEYFKIVGRYLQISKMDSVAANELDHLNDQCSVLIKKLSKVSGHSESLELDLHKLQQALDDQSIALNVLSGTPRGFAYRLANLLGRLITTIRR